MRFVTPIEQEISYAVAIAGLASGTYYNGLAAASTVTTDAVSTTVQEGAGIPVANFKWAKIVLVNGTVGASGALTVYFGQRGKKANDASVTLLPDWAINWISSDDNKKKTGYINLESVPALGAYDRVLWVKSVFAETSTSTVTVTLSETATGFSGEVLEAGASYPGAIIS